MVAAMKDAFPFSSVVGQGDAQMALLLAAIDPSIGGVLLRGEKGSAKTTLARGLASLLPAGAPFVELPVGATEDRVLGSLDLRAALEEGATDRFRPGLLAAAHGGVLYVDEVNLLPDHLVDALLDAAASGVHRVERDGVSHEHPARFVLLGSMNPEEGELRPQLLDRFGLSVEVQTPRDPALRAEAVRRRLSHESGAGSGSDDEALRWRLAAARPAALPDEVLVFASHLAVSVGAESLRADLVLCRSAAALAGWEGRAEASDDDVARVAPLALPHRRRRRPFDPPSLPPDDLADALAQAHAQTSPEPPETPPPTDRPAGLERPGTDDHADADPPTSGADPTPDPPADPSGSPDVGPTPDRPSDAPAPASGNDAAAPPADAADRRHPTDSASPGSGPDRTDASAPGMTLPDGPSWRDLGGDAPGGEALLESRPEARPTLVEGRGRVVGHQTPGPDGPQGVAVLATVRSALARQAIDPSGPRLTTADLREPRRAERQARTVVLCVDASGSMGTKARVEAATGAVVALLSDAYLQRDQVALVAFRGQEAVEVLPPTGSVELARARLADLPTGGPTPLAEGIATALTVAQRAVAKGARPLLVLLTDGRATGEPGALDRARTAAQSVAAANVDALVLDAEEAIPTALGLAHTIATDMHARYIPLPTLTPTTIQSTIRTALPT